MKKLFVAVISAALIMFSSCLRDKTPSPLLPDPNSGYPDDVSIIINNKCAITGCHTAQAKGAAGDLAMETWNQLFEGGSGGAVAIAYRPDQSWIMYYTNTDTNKGVILTPQMPYNLPALSDAEWTTLYNWLAAGAPNSDGVVPFSGNPDRKKFYVSNQGCDLVTVFDADSKIAMRCIDVGQNPGPGDVPHQVKVSPDGKYWYAIFLNGTVIQKYSTADDSYLGSIPLGDVSINPLFTPSGYWNTMAITADGKHAFAIDFQSESSRVAYVNLETMTFITDFISSDFVYLHGSWVNNAGTTLYVTAQNGNHLFKFDVSNPEFVSYEDIVLKPGQQATNSPNNLDPHEVMLSPDETRYFVTCQASNEVRVLNTANDSLIAIIPVGQYPLEMAFSTAHPYLFVTCEYEPCSTDKCKGAVYVIDYNTLQVIKVLQDGLYDPHGIGVMDDEGYAVVASRNLEGSGPAPHHSSECGGRNGFLKLIDLNTLGYLPDYRTEVSVDPYSVSVR